MLLLIFYFAPARFPLPQYILLLLLYIGLIDRVIQFKRAFGKVLHFDILQQLGYLTLQLSNLLLEAIRSFFVFLCFLSSLLFLVDKAFFEFIYLILAFFYFIFQGFVIILKLLIAVFNALHVQLELLLDSDMFPNICLQVLYQLFVHVWAAWESLAIDARAILA